MRADENGITVPSVAALPVDRERYRLIVISLICKGRGRRG